MIFAIDHIVVAAPAEQSRDLRKTLVAAGFASEDFRLEFPEVGVASESVSFNGGGFVECLAAFEEPLAPRVWFTDNPRIIGLGFASDDFDADTNWSAETGAWVMREDHTLPDGSRLNIHAAGPHPHFSDFYVFVMDRPDGRLQFPEREVEPWLSRLSFTGEAADVWRGRLKDWLGPAERPGRVLVGDVELTFRRSARPGISVTPTFERAKLSDRLELSRGSIELVASAEEPKSDWRENG